MAKDENKIKVEYVNVPVLMILLIGCLVLTTWSIYKIADDRYFSRNCERTEAVLVDYESYYTEDGDVKYRSVYEYSADGVSYKVKEKEGYLWEPEAGGKAVIYYDPKDPEDARFNLDSEESFLNQVGYSIFCLVGAFFFFVLLAMLLAHYKVATPLIQMILGSAFAILGICVPILTMGAACPLIIFGLVGIYMIVSGYLKLRGRHEEEQELQGQVDTMVTDAVKNLAGTQTDGFESPTDELTQEEVYAAVENLGRKLDRFREIKSGINIIILGVVIFIIGIVQIVLTIGFMKIFGIIFVIVGLIIIIFGIRRIIKAVRR